MEKKIHFFLNKLTCKFFLDFLLTSYIDRPYYHVQPSVIGEYSTSETSEWNETTIHGFMMKYKLCFIKLSSMMTIAYWEVLKIILTFYFYMMHIDSDKFRDFFNGFGLGLFIMITPSFEHWLFFSNRLKLQQALNVSCCILAFFSYVLSRLSC